ncbi:unnamed protein product [Meganyctiphanes norvegica]|uniref:Receptor expression-enhancing protein n=1 Tax=Meganyctiphanes norvegica TaxID=48144 RepID=A0AAV2Q7C7_MEGNR
MAGSTQKSNQDTLTVTGVIDWAKNDLLKDPRLSFLTEEKNQPFVKYGGLALLALYLVFGWGGQLIVNGIGFVYPAYCSILALESTKKEDDTRWLTYWIVYAFFSLTEFFSDFLLSWFPFYWLAKCVFLVWCFLPVPWNGSDMIYSQVIRPFFLKNQTKIDKTMGKVTEQVNLLGDNVMHMASDAVKSD